MAVRVAETVGHGTSKIGEETRRMGSRVDGRTQMPPLETGMKKSADLSKNTNMPN